MLTRWNTKRTDSMRNREASRLAVGALVLALLLGMLLIQLIGLDGPAAYNAMLLGAFGNKSAIGETIIKMTPPILTGLSFALANRCGLINIGAEGQL